MAIFTIEERLPCCPVEQVFAGVQLKADVTAIFGVMVKNWQPATGEFCEGFFDQSVWRCGQWYRYGNASDPEKLTV